MDIEDLISKITAQARTEPFLVAIDGRGGSGKTTLAAAIVEALPVASVVHLDDFGLSEGGVDRERLLREVLRPLRAGRTANYQRFDWKSKRLDNWITIEPRGVVLVEGVSTLHETLNQDYDFRVWIECPWEVGFERGLLRDREAGGDTEREWLEAWIPEETDYISAKAPREKADYVLYCDS